MIGFDKTNICIKEITIDTPEYQNDNETLFNLEFRIKLMQTYSLAKVVYKDSIYDIMRYEIVKVQGGYEMQLKSDYLDRLNKKLSEMKGALIALPEKYMTASNAKYKRFLDKIETTSNLYVWWMNQISLFHEYIQSILYGECMMMDKMTESKFNHLLGNIFNYKTSVALV